MTQIRLIREQYNWRLEIMKRNHRKTKKTTMN